ncbi:MAG TPA: hypothetical protein DEB46_12900 [Myxococcales bacterium]|nr:hypothetical protein [Myxococcales bacterium]
MTSVLRRLFFTMTLVSLGPGVASSSEQDKQLQYYLVIDDSGSMAFPTKGGKLPAADTHRSAIVAVRAFSRLLTRDDKLQVIPLNQGKALFRRPTSPFALKRDQLLDKHLGPASEISHYAGSRTPCGRALKVLADQLDEHAKDESVKPVVLFMTDGDCVPEFAHEKMKTPGAWSRGKTWSDRLSFYVVTFEGRVEANNPLFAYTTKFRGGGDTLKIRSSADLLPYFAQVIAAARGKIYLHPAPGSQERIGREGGGGIQDIAEGFVGAHSVQMVILAEAETGQTWEDLEFKLFGLESQKEVKPLEIVVPDEFQYDHGGLKDDYLKGLEKAGFKNAAAKLKCEPGPCKRFVSAVVTFSLDPKEFEPGEKVKISLQAKTWSALQLAHYQIELGEVPVYRGSGGQCGELPLDPAAQKPPFQPNTTICLELSPEAKSDSGGGVSILDNSMRDAFRNPILSTLKRRTLKADGSKEDFDLDKVLAPEKDRWIASLPRCPEGHHTVEGVLEWGPPSSRIKLNLGDLRTFSCTNPEVNCRTTDGDTKLNVGSIPAGGTKTMNVTCTASDETLIGINLDGGKALDKMPDCLSVSLVGAKDGFKKLPAGGQATNLQVAFRARPFCHGDIENPEFNGNLQLMLKDGSDPAGNRNFQVDGSVKFKLAFEPQPITAELRRANTGTVKVQADIGAPFYFKLFSKTEAEVDEQDPQVRQPRWVVRSTDVDHPERFQLKPGAASFDYLLTPGRCCSAAGDKLPLMLQPVTKDGKPYGELVTLEVPTTVAGSFLTCWLPTLIQWLLWVLAAAFLIWLVRGYALLMGRNFHFKKGKCPTAYWVNTDVMEDVVAFCQNRDLGDGTYAFWKCKVSSLWRILPHPLVHGRSNRAIFGGKRKGLFKKCFVMKRARVPVQAILYPRRNGSTFDLEIKGNKIKTWSYAPGTQEIEYQDLKQGETRRNLSEIQIKVQNYHFVITKN